MLSTIHMFSVNEINYFFILLIQLQSVVYIQFYIPFKMMSKRSAQKILITWFLR